MYANAISKLMPRNRFEMILAYLHFVNNEAVLKKDQPELFKLGTLLDYLNKRFAQMFTPGENVCIDETLISFRQFIPNKRHKYGIKFFKLCLPHDYTYKFKIYCGAEGDRDADLLQSEDVIELLEDILDCNRTLCTDNFYTSCIG